MILEDFFNTRHIRQSTRKGYKTTVKRYEEYYNLTLEELIDEAIREEDDKIPKRLRSLKKRLLQFRNHLINETDLETSTIKTHMTRLKTIYNSFEVDVPNLPKLKEEETELSYMDLPTKRHINDAYQLSGLKIGSLILFMASSGTGRSECAELRVCDVIRACEGFYSESDLHSILEELFYSLEDIVPIFSLTRIKTNKSYYTFCTPEALNSILEWLLLKYDVLEMHGECLSWEDKVWDLTPRQINYHFQIVNDQLNWGFKRKYRFFRPHTLRKFHASNIGLSAENVDFLQGRSKNRIHATYIKANPERLKEVYINVMDNVTINLRDSKVVKKEEYNIHLHLHFHDDSVIDMF